MTAYKDNKLSSFNVDIIFTCYCLMRLPIQADWEVAGPRPDRLWPSEGRISFENYSAKHRPGQELVLHQIKADIAGGEKVRFLDCVQIVGVSY